MLKDKILIHLHEYYDAGGIYHWDTVSTGKSDNVLIFSNVTGT